MNLELLEQFGQNYPEEFDGALDCISSAITCSFNRRGSLLAVGCNDGRIVIWDFLTRGIAKLFQAHTHPVCSVCWSRDGHKLVSASTDNSVCIWLVQSGECIARWRFPSSVLRVQFNPRNDKQVLVCPLKHQAILVPLNDQNKQKSNEESGMETRRSGASPKNYVLIPLDDDSDLNIVATFDARGKFIYSGNAKGRIVVVKVGQTLAEPLEIMASFRVSNTAIKQIEFASRKKNMFLVNTADRVIRVYDAGEVIACGLNGEPEPVQKLQDLVNKTTWKKCCFSGGPDSEYICAGSARQHAIYIWERGGGTLVKILHGTKGELLLDVVWHPIRPIIASISSGVVSIWSQAQVENWSAFAPDFKELDENIEYEERESEFDIEDEDKSPARMNDENDDDEIEVDVTGVQSIRALLSSDEEDEDPNELVYLQITPEIDEPEGVDGPGTIPQVSPDPPLPATRGKKVRSTDDMGDSSERTMGKNRTQMSDKLRGKVGRPPSKRSGPGDIPMKRTKKKFSEDY